MRKNVSKNRGMTYVELIVVLGIFSVLSSVVIYNYGDFQAKVDLKNLGSDIALQIVQAQKSSINGLLPSTGAPYTTWKPAYGVYFDMATPKQFIYYIDNTNPANGWGPFGNINTISIQKNDFISSIDKCYADPCAAGNSISVFSVTFYRPDASAVFRGSTGIFSGVSYMQITISSPKGVKSYIKIYPSGRIQVN